MNTPIHADAAAAYGPTQGLKELQRLPTSGARAVEPFQIDGVQYLAVPQLAADVPDKPAAMTGGNSDVDLIIYRWDQGRFVEGQRLPVPGGEDAEFFEIGVRKFLATASLRAGAGPYQMDVASTIYEWNGQQFVPFQAISTFAAKQWCHFELEDSHYLALAQGALLPGHQNRESCIFKWDGARFVEFQRIPSAWGYNWLPLQTEAGFLLLYADHAAGSRVLRWSGSEFVVHQELRGGSGRAFSSFRAQGALWLAFANLHDDSLLYRWDGSAFVEHQVLSGHGGREFQWIEGTPGRLVQVNFIHGTREAPLPKLSAFVYGWQGDRLMVDDAFPTTGGTDAALLTLDGKPCLAISNSLGADVRFRADCVIYQILETDAT